MTSFTHTRQAFAAAARTAGLFVVLLPVGTAPGASDAAHFWLSTSSSSSPGPEAPAFSMTVGETTTLYLWGRPTEGLQLRNASLNVVASATGLDLVDGSFLINNMIDGASDRFEFIDDSTASPALASEHTSSEVTGGSIDSLLGFGGFTLNPGLADRGVGPVCSAGEMDCEVATDGEPAWLLGELMVSAVAAGSVDLSLQIGELGMNEATLPDGDYDLDGEVAAADFTVWTGAFGATGLEPADGNADGTVDAADYTVWRDHLGATGSLGLSGATDVRFGVDASMGTEPKHNASTDRSTNLAGDDPDAVITISAPATAVPEPGALALAMLALALLRRARSARHG